MRIEVGEHNEMLLKEIYGGVTLISANGEKLHICMRDSGFEFTYSNQFFECKQGKVIQHTTKSQ
jgi:hypothetical protein